MFSFLPTCHLLYSSSMLTEKSENVNNLKKGEKVLSPTSVTAQWTTIDRVSYIPNLVVIGIDRTPNIQVHYPNMPYCPKVHLSLKNHIMNRWPCYYPGQHWLNIGFLWHQKIVYFSANFYGNIYNFLMSQKPTRIFNQCWPG